MLVAITCPACGHRGQTAANKLPRALTCAHCRVLAWIEHGTQLQSGVAIAARIEATDHVLPDLRTLPHLQKPKRAPRKRLRSKREHAHGLSEIETWRTA